MSDIESDYEEVIDDIVDDEVDVDEDAEVEVDEDVEDNEESEESEEEIEEVIPHEVPQNIVRTYVVRPEDRRTSNFMSVLEQTDYVSIRSTMIAANNDCQVPVDDLVDPIMMARRELMQRKSPLMIKREIGTKKEMDASGAIVTVQYCEYWDPNVMGFSKIYHV
jgi:hypothetical protein